MRVLDLVFRSKVGGYEFPHNLDPKLTDATVSYEVVHYCLFGRSMIAMPLPFTQIEARAENASCRPSGDQTG
jgi:hypothetical protein